MFYLYISGALMDNCRIIQKKGKAVEFDNLESAKEFADSLMLDNPYAYIFVIRMIYPSGVIGFKTASESQQYVVRFVPATLDYIES
jgi:hypothetical protein